MREACMLSLLNTHSAVRKLLFFSGKNAMSLLKKAGDCPKGFSVYWVFTLEWSSIKLRHRE